VAAWHEALSELARRVNIPEMDGSFAPGGGPDHPKYGGTVSGGLETLADTLQERQTLRRKKSSAHRAREGMGVVFGGTSFLLLRRCE